MVKFKVLQFPELNPRTIIGYAKSFKDWNATGVT